MECQHVEMGKCFDCNTMGIHPAVRYVETYNNGRKSGFANILNNVSSVVVRRELGEDVDRLMQLILLHHKENN